MLALFFCATLLVNSLTSVYAYSGVYAVPDFPTKGEYFKIPFDIDKPLLEQTAAWCEAVNNLESCQYIQDELVLITGRLRAERGPDMRHHYTPTMPTSTMEDFQSSRTSMIKYIQNKFHFQDYLEIGCGDNLSFLDLSGSGIFRRAECVDPTRGGTHRMTSDAYFSSLAAYNQAHNIPNNTSFDLIFVDGLHSAEQSYRDVINALTFVRPGGIIMMHDCNPRQYRFQVSISELGSDPMGQVWNGDVWKAVVALRALHGLEIDMVVGDFDYGVGVIRFRSNASISEFSSSSSIPTFTPTGWLPESDTSTSSHQPWPLLIADQVPESVKSLYQFLASLSAEEIIENLKYDLLNIYRRDLLNLKSVSEVREWLNT